MASKRVVNANTVSDELKKPTPKLLKQFKVTLLIKDGMVVTPKSRVVDVEYNKNYEKEMHRFCNKQGYQIVGGASKLWKYYNSKYSPNSVITYADKRFSDGTFYRKIGFKEKNMSQPNFWVFGNGITGLSHRIAWQKHKLESKIATFDSDLTAWDNMLINGYDRVWDCGNYVFEFVKG